MTTEELKAVAASVADEVPCWSWWRHRKGGLYMVLGTGFEESAVRLVVIYRSTEGVAWTRPVAEFLDGRFVREEIK
jgi:hypothetical protein